jgi:hypothetical protein
MAGFNDYRERRLERLRLGQGVCELAELPSDPEIRVALVPLTEAEYSNTLLEADKVIVTESPAGLAYRDETQRRYCLYFATREVENTTKRFFADPSEVGS